MIEHFWLPWPWVDLPIVSWVALAREVITRLRNKVTRICGKSTVSAIKFCFVTIFMTRKRE